MASRKITIIVVPEGKHRVRQFSLPRFLPLLCLFLIISCVAYLFFMWKDYRSLKAQMPRLAQLEQETRQTRNQFTHLSQRIHKMGIKLCELNDFGHRLKVMVNLETDDDEGRFQGIGGSDPELLDPKRAMARGHEEMVRAMHRSLDELDHEMAHSKRDKSELYRFLESQKMLLASTPSIWPTNGWLSSGFGFRVSPFTSEREFHKGIDISTRMGAPIIAPADGVVTSVTRNRGYGNVLTLSHGYGLVTRYAHLKKALVKKGQRVKRGETIALVGNTGRSTGTHLHYEVRLNKVCVNPRHYILN